MRLFIAVDFPPEIKKLLAEEAAALRRRGVSGHFTREDNLHLTLAFLGEQPPSGRDAAVRAMERCGGAAFPVAFGGYGTFRGGRDGDILYRRVEGGEALSGLHRRLSEALKTEGFVLERRAFRPHLTLARGVPQMPEALPAPQPAACRAEAMTLFCSEQVQGRRVYTPLHVTRFPFNRCSLDNEYFVSAMEKT